VQKADLQSTDTKGPDHVPVYETVIQPDDQRYWLYAAIDPETNEFLHINLETLQNLGLSELYFRELREKHIVDDIVVWMVLPESF